MTHGVCFIKTRKRPAENDGHKREESAFQLIKIQIQKFSEAK